MAGGQEKWYFTKEQLQNSPSRKCGLDADKELAYRQQAANLIQDMGQRLQVSQLCINTAIVYMHRFYAFHSFTQFHRNAIAAAALFLAAKVEEQPRKLEYVIKVAHVCLHRGEGVSALTPDQYQEQAQDLVFNENVLLQTLGFDVAIDHPHTHVVRTCHLVKAPKDLAQTSYFMASNSLHLTTMCLQYRPTVVACFCIHLASKWSNWAIPQSSEGRHWFSYVDRSVTSDLLEKLTAEFLHIFDKCPSRLKRKMMTMSNSGSSPSTPLSQAGAGAAGAGAGAGSTAAVPTPDKKQHEEFDKSFDKEYERERRRAPMPGGYVPAPQPAPPAQLPAPTQPHSHPPPQKIDYNLYREKRDREERERRQRAQQAERTAERPEARVAEGARSVESRNLESRSAPRPPVPVQRPHHSHKPHPSWAHKPPHHKPPHEHRHHRAPHTLPTHSTLPTLPTAGGSGPTPAGTAPPTPGTSGGSSANHQIPPATPEMPQRTRPPSLFSPENATPAAAAAQPRPRPPPQPQPTPPPHHRHKPDHRPQPPPQEKPPSPKKRPDPTTAIRDMQPPTILSPFSSPPLKEQQPQPQNKPRQRHQSSSEPELVPVVKKLDETPGFENLLRDPQRVSSVKSRPPEIKQERKPEPTTRSLNGIETDPTLVSNLLKESLAKPAPITVATEKKSPVEIKKETEPPVQPIQPQPQPKPEPQPQPQPQEETSEHSKHKKEKKKKEKHKHKDRDKSKEERKKHKKDKERERKQEATPVPTETGEGALKITIPRDRLSASPGFKIKIPKERLAVPPPPPSSGIKIKISKEVLETSRKRPTAPEPGAGPPQKMVRHNGQPKVEPSSNGHKQ